MRFSTKIALIAASLALLFPGAAALAKEGRGHDGDDNRSDRARAILNLNNNDDGNRREDRREDRRDDRRDGHGFFSSFFRSGTVTAVSSNSFTMRTNAGATFTVNVADAKILLLGRSQISLSELDVNDRVWVQGPLNGTTITATTVHALEAGVAPAAKKGTVTAVNGNTITLSPKNADADPVTITTDSNTEVRIQDDPTAEATTADVTVGSRIKVFGLRMLDGVIGALTLVIK